MKSTKGGNVASLIFGVVLIAFGAWLVFSTVSSSNQKKVIFETSEVAVETPETPEEFALGLGNRDSLGEDAGMLFVYNNEAQRYFLMKNMRFSIDIIWINADKRVVDITEYLSPDTYPERFTSSKPAQYVLEVNAGYSDKYDINIGDQAIVSL